MQHIINLAIELEDNRIRSSVEKNAETQIISNIQGKIEKEYFEKRWGGNPIESMVSGTVSKLIEEHKEEIIDKVAKMLCDRMARRRGMEERILEAVVNNKEDK